ncbi:TIGR02594 family protein [Fodinibius salsisoli]|uniref:TIGR02594 family protein n=1 Tax=Fodinibius salsisoli TaxID=2820877 RepID=A0ABT3PTA7_9BACT|nr:TIGR02594 family protein [Fodinibius salsisoli]MCW9709090.1 TIGR02594 family protein [Fodinibius salsisoli]
MENLLKIASGELGITEIAGSTDNERILQYAEDIGQTWINDDETPWCSIFMNWVALKAGSERSNSAAARSWLNVGFSVANPEPGDIVVYWRGHPDSHQGHVGIFMGFSNDHSRIYTLGGNQNNAVSISAYPADRLLDFRRLKHKGDIELEDKILKRGDRGQAVVQLQDALKLADFDVGTSDGIFGPKTEGGVKQLQSTNFDLEVNGIFDESSREFLLELLNSE